MSVKSTALQNGSPLLGKFANCSVSKIVMHDVGLASREKALIIAVVKKGTDPAIVSEHLDELELLLDTAGADVAFRMYQERAKPDGATAIGKGKVAEVKQILDEGHIHLVVFDDDLSPVQVRNLEEELNVKVLDRSGVIIDIFASRARSVEARTQVELAQLEYLLPRLTRMWTHLSKQFGGVGTKGPGETQIESDRRLFRGRIQRLKEKLIELDVHRLIQRKNRIGIPRFALVGYTNAGKSTLMQALTAADVYVEDRLFATLDTTVRAFELPSGQKSLLSDTVGFIRKLPAQLVASFRSTLAETLEADVLIHVADVAHAHVRDHVAVVEETLATLGVTDTPVIMVFNKIDLVEDKHIIDDTEVEYPGCIFISASRSVNLNRLLQEMQHKLESISIKHTLHIPYEAMRDVARVYEEVEVLDRNDGDEHVTLVVSVPSDKLPLFTNTFARYLPTADPTRVN